MMLRWEETFAIVTDVKRMEEHLRPTPVKELVEGEVDDPNTKVSNRVMVVEEHIQSLTTLLIEFKDFFFHFRSQRHGSTLI